jgi:hypothetical protein
MAMIEWGDMEEEHDETAEIVADAVAQERAAVVAFVRGARLDELSAAIERGEHRRGEGG